VRFFRSIKKRGRLLDIGCGMGYFLNACRTDGYHVEGVDISDDSASYVRETLNIPVMTGPVESLHYGSESIDIITMWHFLEHADDPRVYLKKAWEWLKPDGLLVVDVPNYEGTDARKTWNNWTGWSLPYHLYHFTEKTLCDMLSKHGFKTIRKKDYLSEYIKEKLEKIFVMRPFARLIARCYSGHSIAVVARKEL
jgi:2-polyprenyl-3-methyl-5-hydroxy-6-metoxy-1,4-benzoquinol methylase